MNKLKLPDLSRKTILQIIPDLALGGAERTTVEVAEAIVNAGGRALVLSKGGRLESRLQAGGGELIRMNVASKNPLVIHSNANRITNIIRAQNVDLIHARSRAPGWSAYISAKRTQIPFVTTYHGIYSGQSGLKRYYNSVMTKGAALIANSEWTAQHIASVHAIPPERITVIPRGVDPLVFDPATLAPARKTALSTAWNIAPDDDRLILLLPGRLTRWKGQWVAIAALAQLNRKERAGLHLILAGDAQAHGKYVGELKQAIKTHGLDHHVSLVKHIDDMPAAYSLADIVLAPSTRPEAFGRIAIEGSAMARPVIVSDHGGQRETVRDRKTGMRAMPGCAKDLARCIGTLTALTAEERRSMGKHGRRFIEDNFTKARLQRATLGVYKRLLNR